MTIMGFRYGLAIGAALALGPGAAWAQDNSAAPQAPGALQGFQLDPARDTGRPRPPEREGPEIDDRPTSALPAPLQVQPVPAAAPPPVTSTVTPPVTVRPQPETQASQAPRDTQSAPQITTPDVAPKAAPQNATPSPARGTTAVVSPTASQPPSPETTAAPVESSTAIRLPSILATAILVGVSAGLVLWLWRRRRRHHRIGTTHDLLPVVPPVAGTEREPVPSPGPGLANAAAIARPPALPEHYGARALLVLEFHPLGARSTLIGAAVGYRLVLRNAGDSTAQDIAIAARIANADTRQEQALTGFFAEPVYAPTHRIARIDAGRTAELTGELRLAHDAIVPILIEDRSLLIPLVAFSAHYAWGQDGRGYSGAAFIVGQESDPPRERMAPFRLDQGPRQYRAVGSRPTGTAPVT